MDEEDDSIEEEALVEEEVLVFKKKSRAGSSHSSTRLSVGPIFEVSTVTKNDIAGIRERFQVPKDFHLHAPRPEDRVTSGPADCLAVYEEDLNADFHFAPSSSGHLPSRTGSESTCKKDRHQSRLFLCPGGPGLVWRVKLSPEKQGPPVGSNNKNDYSDYLIEEEEGVNDHNVIVKCTEIQSAIPEGVGEKALLHPKPAFHAYWICDRCCKVGRS